MKWILLLLRLLLSIFFIISAYGKLVSIESFEIYIFRSSFLTFDVSTFVARAIIGIEFMIALALLSKLAYRQFWKVAMIFILGFTAFLAWQAGSGDEGNCFCLGELMDMSPTESLIKNVVIIVLLLMVRNESELKYFRFKNFLSPLLYGALLFLPFLLSPPDYFVKGSFNAAEHNQLALNDVIEKDSIPADFISGRKLLGFYSLKCRFCKMSSTRISAIVEKRNIDHSQVNYIFGGSKGSPEEFYDETHSLHFDYARMSRDPFLNITMGKMPLILLIEDGRVVQDMNFRTIDEERIEDFLKGDSK